MIDVNLLGAIIVSKAALSHLQDGGCVVHFASSSYTRGRPGYATYSAAKAGLVNFVQGFADEVAARGVRVNVVNPQRTLTPMRTANFGQENAETLLQPRTVAIATLSVLATQATGTVFDVRKEDELRIVAAFDSR